MKFEFDPIGIKIRPKTLCKFFKLQQTLKKPKILWAFRWSNQCKDLKYLPTKSIHLHNISPYRRYNRRLLCRRLSSAAAAMSLLEVIIKASSAIQTLPNQEQSYPIVLNPEPIFLKLNPENDDVQAGEPVRKVVGWEISQTDKELIELGQKFYKKLKRNLKNTKTFGKGEFLESLTSHLNKIKEKIGISVTDDTPEEGYACQLVEKLGFSMARDVKGLVLEGCISLEVWDVLESLVNNGIVEHSCMSNLIHNLIEKRKSDLIVSCVKHLKDLQAYDLMCILKYFLVLPGDDDSLMSVREDWESQALLALDKASGKGISSSGKEKRLAKEAALLIMLGHDGFSTSELCVHYLLSSGNLDDVIFSACIGKLNGEEINALIHYLGKWLRKYEKFPQVVPCPKASFALGLHVCDWIPSLEDVVRCLGFVVDEHFSSLVLHSEFHEELRSLQVVVSSLAAEATLCGSLANLIEQLRSERKDEVSPMVLNHFAS